MAEGAVSWRLEGSGAVLSCGPLRGRAVFDATGISFLINEWRGQPVDKTSVLASGGPTDQLHTLQLVESYVRGSDLVANFGKTSRNVATHIYWRASWDEALSAAGVELVLSVQTDLLDSRPKFTVGSFVWDAEPFHTRELSPSAFRPLSADSATAVNGSKPILGADSEINLFAFRIKGLGLSYAEMVHPSDFASAQVSADYQLVSIESTIFPERLEKGVIRRARICGWFLPAENDLEVAVELARRFVNEPPPLTT